MDGVTFMYCDLGRFLLDRQQDDSLLPDVLIAAAETHDASKSHLAEMLQRMARILTADVEAKKWIAYELIGSGEPGMVRAAQYLAATYSDHADYRQEWALDFEDDPRERV